MICCLYKKSVEIEKGHIQQGIIMLDHIQVQTSLKIETHPFLIMNSFLTAVYFAVSAKKNVVILELFIIIKVNMFFLFAHEWQRVPNKTSCSLCNSNTIMRLLFIHPSYPACLRYAATSSPDPRKLHQKKVSNKLKLKNSSKWIP